MTPRAGYGILRFATDLKTGHRPHRSHLMGFIGRRRMLTTTFTDAIALEALERVIPLALLQAAAREADVPTQRRRKLPADVTLLLCVAMSLWTQHALDVVLHKMTHGVRLF